MGSCSRSLVCWLLSRAMTKITTMGWTSLRIRPAPEPGGSACRCWNGYVSSATTRLKDALSAATKMDCTSSSFRRPNDLREATVALTLYSCTDIVRRTHASAQGGPHTWGIPIQCIEGLMANQPVCHEPRNWHHQCRVS